MTKKLLASVLLATFLVACGKDDAPTPLQPTSSANTTEASYQAFGVALSKAITKYPQLARTLQIEALKAFDNNTEVLYHSVKRTKIDGNQTVEDLIRDSWDGDKASFDTFTERTPLLNIFASDLEVIDKSLALSNWDTSREVGVVVPSTQDKSKTLLVDGKPVATIGASEIPSIPTFVVNENKRVEVKSSFRSLTDGVSYTYGFTHDAFDGTKKNGLRNEYVYEEPNSSDMLSIHELDPTYRAIWTATQNGAYQVQRALLYYSGKEGSLNPNINEYLYRFKLAPSTYNDIAGAGSEADDPKITDKTVVTYAQRHASIDEIISNIWTQGSFAFAFEVITPISSGYTQNHKLAISVFPKELFIMNPDREYRNPTWFRKTRYTYRINPSKLEARWVYPHKIGVKTYARIEGSWDLSKQGLSKMIRVSEIDKGTKRTETRTFSSEFASNMKFSLSNIIQNILSIEGSTSSKEAKSVSATISFTDADDDLGSVMLYFSDPIIIPNSFSGSNSDRWYTVKNLSTGSVSMTFLPLINK